jgi:hypothetical protein
MTDHEWAVILHLNTLFKQGSGDPPAPGTAMETDHIQSLHRRWLSDDPRVMADAQAGWHAARQRTAGRIVRDHPGEVHLNRCPACGALTALPRSAPVPTYLVPRSARRQRMTP